jgi:hypothetical protein
MLYRRLIIGVFLLVCVLGLHAQGNTAPDVSGLSSKNVATLGRILRTAPGPRTSSRPQGTEAAVVCVLAGPDAQGKRRAINVLVAGLEREVVRIDLGRVASKYIGETEKNLSRFFESAEQSGSIIVLDESTGLFGEREHGQGVGWQAGDQVIAYLMSLCRNHTGLVVLSTNVTGSLRRELQWIRFRLDF